MAIDYTATAQGLANLLFVQPNATGTLGVDDLTTLAQAIDTQMSSDITNFIAALPSATAAVLTSDQLNKAMAYVAMKRAGLA